MGRHRGARDELRFRALYQRTYPDVLRFLQRRVPPDHAEDVAADTFTVAWRRLGDLPESEDDARAWLFGIARWTIRNQVRGADRRRALGVRLADQPTPALEDPGLARVVLETDVARAWRHLSPLHQEALALTVFDDLSAPQAAAVLGISPVAYRLRLSRARRALRAHLDPARPLDDDGPVVVGTGRTR